MEASDLDYQETDHATEEPVHRRADHPRPARGDAGAKPAEVCRRHGVTEKSFYRWRREFGGMEVNEAKRLGALKDEKREAQEAPRGSEARQRALKAVLERR